jgi:hypothetical protein
VLAGAQRVGGEVGAGAIVIAGVAAADVDAVGTLRLGVVDLEFGEDGVLTLVFQAEVLLPAELPAQLDLPVLQRHVLGLVQPRHLGRPAALGRGFLRRGRLGHLGRM